MRDSTDKLLQELSEKLDVQPEAAAQSGPLEDALDHWRIHLVELVYLLNACYRDAQYWEGIKTEKETIRHFAKTLYRLAQMPNAEKAVRMLRKERGTGKVTGKPDYEVSFSGASVDSVSVGAIIKRMGIRVKHLEGRLQKAFETFDAEGIDSLILAIPDDSPESLDALRVVLRVLACFRQAAEKGTAITFSRNGAPVSIRPIRNEQNQPDPNLTLIAAVNDLPAESIEDIARKVAALLQRPDAARLRRQFANTHQAIFAIKSLGSRLRKPPIEVNPVRRSSGGWTGGAAAGPATGAAAATPTGAASLAGGSPPAPGGSAGVMDEAAFQSGLERLIGEAFKDRPAEAACALQSLSGEASAAFDGAELGRRLGLLPALLAAASSSAADPQLAAALVQRIQAGLEHVSPEVLSDFVVQEGMLKAWDGEKEQEVGQAGEQLAGIIDMAKDRSTAARKRPSTGEEPLYMVRDAQSLSEYFGLSAEEMEAILKIFRGCFDQRGNFQKVSFEKRIPDFARFRRKIFPVLWEFLKDMPRRSDRLPFLNSLQVITREFQQPIQAVRILLADFTGDAAQVAYPDRNAIMLTIQFLRLYNKECNIDIELTPEEVLMVKTGLDPKVVNYAMWKVNGDQKRFLSKVLAIRRRLLAAFDPGYAGVAPMPPRFLLALERELHILLAIAGGDTSASILHNALSLYGNPGAAFFQREETRPHLSALMQHLSVLIRGLGRVGADGDRILLDQVQQREKDFIKLSADPRHTALVRRLFGWVEPAKKEIESRLKGGPPPSRPAAASPKNLSSTNTFDL